MSPHDPTDLQALSSALPVLSAAEIEEFAGLLADIREPTDRKAIVECAQRGMQEARGYAAFVTGCRLDLPGGQK